MSDAPKACDSIETQGEVNEKEEEIIDVSVEDFKSMAPVSAPPTPSSPPSVLPVNPRINRSSSSYTPASKVSSSTDVPTDVSRWSKRSMTSPFLGEKSRLSDWNDITLPPILSSRVALALEAIGGGHPGVRSYRSLPGSPVCKEVDSAFATGTTMRMNRRKTYNRKYSSMHKDPFGMKNSNATGDNKRPFYSTRRTTTMGAIGGRRESGAGQYLPKSETTRIMHADSFHTLSPSKTHNSVVNFGRAESEPDLTGEDTVHGEVPVLLAQMNNAAVELNEHENELRITGSKITKLDMKWKKDRELLLASVGAFHIQRADLYFTKMRELCHWKEQGSKLAERYSVLSTTIGTMESSKAFSDRETRWREDIHAFFELRKGKATKAKNDIEQQMKDVAHTVARLQQEASARSQEYPISIKKATPFFEEYGLFLKKRREAIAQQKELEQKIQEAKLEYKSAMDRLEDISKEIHEERGTLDAATKSSIPNQEDNKI